MNIVLLGPATPRDIQHHLASEPGVPSGMGGTPVNALARRLVQIGHRVTVITGSSDINAVWRYANSNLSISVVPFRPRPWRRIVDLFAAERRLLKEEILRASPDIVHAHWTYEFALAAISSKLPHLITIHDAPLTILRHMLGPYRLLRLLMACMVRIRGQYFSAVSPALASSWARQMLTRRDRLSVIPNIVDLPVRPKREIDKAVILDVANASKLKNVGKLIQAFNTIADDHPAAELRLIGPGLGSGSRLARFVNAKHRARVMFIGAVSPAIVSHHLSESTVFCHPSLEESQGMAVLEAMSYGVPVVVAKQAKGALWSVDNGSAGLIVDGKNAAQISDSLSQLLGSAELRKHLRKAAATILSARFSASAAVEDYVQLYGRAVASHAWRAGEN